MIHALYALAPIALLANCANLPSGSNLVFERGTPEANKIEVVLGWNPNPTEYYTPRGQMTEISLHEGARSVAIPEEMIATIQDIWPERVELASSTPGFYELRIPSGVGEGSLDVFRFDAFQFSGRINAPTLDFPELKKIAEQDGTSNGG
jgi:hypothetical protein